MTLTVHSATCPKLPDGRSRHLYRKVDGEFVCTNCGQVSDPAQRWERPDEVRGGPSAVARLSGRRDEDCQVPGAHASTQGESARTQTSGQQFRTHVPTRRGETS